MSVENSVIKVSDKFSDYQKADLDAITESLNSSISGTSETVEAYEKCLSEWFECNEAIAVSSGGAALSVALYAAGVKPGDEVILTPTSPLCTVYPIMWAQATPVFCDVLPDSFGANLEDLKGLITSKTKAIIDIPMWGYPTQVDQLQAVAQSHGIPLILDLAHSHGSKLHGKHLSAYGDLSCFSTHDRKPLATGEGGFVLTDNPALAETCRLYTRFGNLNGENFGLNFKLGALQAALGMSRLSRLGGQIESRRKNANTLLELIDNPHVNQFPVLEGGSPNYYALLLNIAFQDNMEFMRYLSSQGIPSDVLKYGGKPLYKFPLITQYHRSCPNADQIFKTLTTIPVHPGVTSQQLEHIAAAINNYKY